MNAAPQTTGEVGNPVWEVCVRPMPLGARPLRVRACEFPFHVHDDRREHLGPLAS